jgi:carbonic anhydrase
MTGKREWLIVRCIDGRFNIAIDELLADYHVGDFYDIISLPGGPKDIHKENKILVDAISTSVRVNYTQKVMLIQHTDCKAYGGREKCGGSEELDLQFHRKELETAKEALKWFGMEIYIYPILMHISNDGSKITYEQIDILEPCST